MGFWGSAEVGEDCSEEGRLGKVRGQRVQWRWPESEKVAQGTRGCGVGVG